MKVTKEVYNELKGLFKEGADEDCYSFMELVHDGKDITPNLRKLMFPYPSEDRRHIQAKLCKCWERVTSDNFDKVFKIKDK